MIIRYRTNKLFVIIGLCLLLFFEGSSAQALELTAQVDSGGFFDLQLEHVLFLLIVGFIGGLVSGFMGSDGTFLLTPAMMSMGVPAITAVASNMCHKFPRALVGFLKRTKSGQVDIKLGLVMGIFASAGVLYGASVQTEIRQVFGDVASNLYVSIAFIVLLLVVGGYALYDALKTYQLDSGTKKHHVTKLARWVYSINIPGTMMRFPSIDSKVSVLFIIPIGFFAGLLAATIAVSGFIGITAMIYVLGVPGLIASATGLLIVFIIGLGGTIIYAIDGFLDIRLAMILLAGSAFGVQLGTVGTTYVKDFMIKFVMGATMILVLLNRAFKVPVYLSDMGKIEPLSERAIAILDYASFVMLLLALGIGLVLIIYAIIKGYIKYLTERVLAEEQRVFQAMTVEEELYPTIITQLSPTGRFERILVVSDKSKSSAYAEREAIKLAQRTDGILSAMSVVVTNPEHESLARELIEQENRDVLTHLETFKNKAIKAGISCETSVRHGIQVYQEIVNEAIKNQTDVIVMGRRGYTGLKRVMMGSNTAKVIGYAKCNILIVPPMALIEGRKILVAVDGSRHGDIAAHAAAQMAKYFHAPVLLVSVVYSEMKKSRHAETVEIIKRVESFMNKEGVSVEVEILGGKPAQAIIEVANNKGVDLIVVGSHGRTGLDKMLMGSVSDRVIGHAECAVLVAKG